MKNLLTVDLEDWFQAFSIIPVSAWGQFESRIQIGTARLLSLFAERGLRATFFVLGDLAVKFPDLIRRLADAGHEIASHGHSHRPVYEQLPQDFRADVERSLEALAAVYPKTVRGYRAPWWSVTRESLWAIEILGQLGFQYDSSIFPVRAGYYGIPDAPRTLHERALKSGRKLIEVPPLTRRFCGRNWPAGGGFFLRNLPLGYHVRAIELANRSGQPALVYVHPWELDPQQPRLSVPLLQRFIHYSSLEGMERKFTRLLDAFEFGPVEEALPT
ncbi:MAG: DUF3473 domain-containing protein [Planctomycetes bacterium]|nr:DUF3473 domain-containing protein [Planctomycetota bacterium]